MSETRLRPAAANDIAALQGIEAAAGELFRPLGTDFRGRRRSTVVGTSVGLHRAGRAWVVDVEGEPGSMDETASWAREREMPAMTLCTFRDVPWNGPYYEQLGFRWLADSDVTTGLRRLRDEEMARGLDRAARGWMRREV